MATFNTTKLAGNKVLVEGEADGTRYTTMLDGSQWQYILEQEQVVSASADFDEVVSSFFAPLTEAADALQEATTTPVDTEFYYVIQQGKESDPGSANLVLDLEDDTVILRMIDRGDFSRLRWAHVQGEDRILITEAAAPTGEAEEEDHTALFDAE